MLAALAFVLSGCNGGHAVLGWTWHEEMPDGTNIDRTIGCGWWAMAGVIDDAVRLGCVSKLEIAIPPGACQLVFVTNPEFSTTEVRANLAPLFPDQICPERIDPYD